MVVFLSPQWVTVQSERGQWCRMPYHQSPRSFGYTGAETGASCAGVPFLGQCKIHLHTCLRCVSHCGWGLKSLCLFVAVPHWLSDRRRDTIILPRSDGHLLHAAERKAHPARLSGILGEKRCFSRSQVLSVILHVSCFWVSDQIEGFDVKHVDEYHLTGMESTLFVGWEHRPAPPSEGRGDNRGKPEAKRSADKMEKKGKHASGKVTARCDHFLVQTVLYRQKNNHVCFLLGSSDIGRCRGCVSGSALVGAPAFLYAGVCAGGTHHQHPSERAVATGTEELASPPARHRG